MNDYKTILAALDCSGPSEAAAAQAVALGRALGADVVFCHVIDARYMAMAPANLVEPPALQEERLRKVAQRRMTDLVARTPEAENVRIKLRLGIPSDEILEEIDELSADMLIMGTHGRRGLKRAVLGSQAELVMRRCPVPILVVHEEETEEEPVTCQTSEDRNNGAG